MPFKRSYIIASTPRTGSSLLCEGLTATGIAGRPSEVFAPILREEWNQYWSLDPDASFQDFLHAAFLHGTTDNGVYGLKIQWMHVATLAQEMSFQGERAEVLEHLIPGATFINIVRHDRRSQALSWFRAIATNEWWRTQSAENTRTPSEVPALDCTAVRSLEVEIEMQQQAWKRYFLMRGIEPLIVEYEELAQDYPGQIARVLAFLGLDASAASSLPPPRLVRQSDRFTEHWRRVMDATTCQEVEHDEITP
jgi:LPS sulfotransferase NodH